MSSRTDLLVEVAVLYYEEGVTQTEIAKKLNLSRPTVATMLQEARDTGIVKITVQHTSSTIIQEQEKLRKKYSLKTLLIASDKSQQPKAEVGALCAKFVEEHLATIQNLGIGWGTTVYEYVEHASYFDFSQLTITPLIGGVGFSDVKIHSNHLAFVLAQKYQCDVRYFYAPALAESLKQKNMFIQSELVKQVLEAGRKVDMAIVGIGNPAHSSTYHQLGYITEEDAQELTKQHSVGDIGSTFFNEKAQAVHTQVSDRMIGISLQEMQQIPDLVVLATGEEKIQSIQTLLENQVIDHLIIDETIAKAL